MSRIDYINLIYKDLSKEISVGEKSILKNWVLQNSENQVIVDELTMIWENSSQLIQHELQVDENEEFELLMARIDADKEEANTPTPSVDTKIIRMPWRAISIAAGFALIFGLTYLFINQNGDNNKFVELKTGNEVRELLMADGTQIFLNKNSTIKYPSEFDGDTREIEFTGEAFFDVAKDPNRPFIINTPFESVTVLGTSFNVRAYGNESNSEIAVSTGKVNVNSGSSSIIVEPNQKVIVNHSSDLMGLESTESLNELAWHTNTLRFANTPLNKVILDMSEFYGVQITLNNKAIENCFYTDTFVREELDIALQSIAVVFDVTIQKLENGDYVLDGGSCE